jgi:plastocyanin
MNLTAAMAGMFAGGVTVMAAGSVLAYDEATVTGGGTVSGQVVFNGTVPTQTIIPNKDLQVCGGPREEPLVEVGPDHGVANALVYLADVPKGKAWPVSAKPPELDNVKCRFEPEIQVVRPGPIDIVNKDPVLHNTHGYYGKRTAFNTALPNQNQRITAELLKTGTVRVDCDAHGWMLGWIYVRDNPYYAITGADGKFSITDVPPGTYTLVMVQSDADVEQQPVTVSAEKPVVLTMELKGVKQP